MSHLCIKWGFLLRDANYTTVYLASYFVISLKLLKIPNFKKLLTSQDYPSNALFKFREALTWNAMLPF